MIFTDSRYATGNVFTALKPSELVPHVTVFRVFPDDSSKYTLHTWREEDRIDLLASAYFNDASLWWKIMDYNPEQLNPMDIPVGTNLRIPNVAG